jgi:hypothetical protein
MVRSVKIAVKKAVLLINLIIKLSFYTKMDVILNIFSIIPYHTYNNTAARNLKLKRQYLNLPHNLKHNLIWFGSVPRKALQFFPFFEELKMPPNSPLSQIYDLIDGVSLIVLGKYGVMRIYVYNGNKIRHINLLRRGAESRKAT